MTCSYWDEPLDVENTTSSPIFDQNTGFGGNGSSLTRNFHLCSFKAAAQKHVDDCMLLQKFEQVRSCLKNGPHASGHSGVGGLVCILTDYICSLGLTTVIDARRLIKSRGPGLLAAPYIS